MDEQETPARSRSRTVWTVQKDEWMVELWAEQPCLFDVSSAIYHDGVEKEKQWTGIAGALLLAPGKYTTVLNGNTHSCL